jgi:hypothetical protein
MGEKNNSNIVCGILHIILEIPYALRVNFIIKKHQSKRRLYINKKE